jgi:hypothetical protein
MIRLFFTLSQCFLKAFLFLRGEVEFLGSAAGFSGGIEEGTNMTNTQPAGNPRQNREAFEPKAEYYGLAVEVVCRMERCSLIRYREREFVINTEDLCLRRSVGRAA